MGVYRRVRTGRHGGGGWTFAIAGLVLVSVMSVAGPAYATDPVYVETPLAGWSPRGGSVYTIVELGDRVYIGGSFTSLVSPSGLESVARSRLASISKSTGELDRGWNAPANGTVRALATDGTRLFVGGEFTSIGGATRARVAAVSPVTGAALAGWRADATGVVRDFAVVEQTLYLGGDFTSISGQSRARLAAVRTSDGALLSTWRPTASWTVHALAVVPGSQNIAVGGLFSQLSGQPRRYLGSVNRSTGQVTGWAPPPDCINQTNPCFVFDLQAAPSLVFGAVAGPGGRVSAWDAASGVRQWSQWGDGDVQALSLVENSLYAGGHFAPTFGLDTDGRSATRHRLAALNATTGALLPFAPVLAGDPGVWAIAASSDRLRIGGSFAAVEGNAALSRYAEFAVAGDPPPPPPAAQTLVPAGATWSYRDDGADLQTAWRTPDYNDVTWPSGPAQLGFGDADEQTVLSGGRLTYYFRHAFTSTGSSGPVLLRILRDDGLVVYLNGTEVWRDNLPTGTITSATRASVAIAGADEQAWHEVNIPNLLVEEENTLAVEVHNSSAGSSDISFDLELRAG